jgi:hypothetical protein
MDGYAALTTIGLLLWALFTLRRRRIRVAWVDQPHAVAPWKDYNGVQVRDGDIIKHPSGEVGVVRFMPKRGLDCAFDQWWVDYGTGRLSRLTLQLDDKGCAIVVTHGVIPTPPRRAR